MSFKLHCENLDLRLREEDYSLIKWRLDRLPHPLHKRVLERYTAVYLEELEKCNPNNYARHAIARHYANRYIKLYR